MPTAISCLLKKCSIIDFNQVSGKHWLARITFLSSIMLIKLVGIFLLSEIFMNVIERIKEQLENHPVVLYMKGTPDFPQCGFSGRTVQVLDACHAKYMYVNIFEDPELREALKEYSHWPTYPQLYIGGELVGGCDIVMDLYSKGELTKMLAAAGSIEQ